MSQNGKTPGRAAYEAQPPSFELEWDDLDDIGRKFWDGIAQAAIDAAPQAGHFRLERDTDVHLECPYCFEVLWLTNGEAPTLGDVIKAANEHDCEEGDGIEAAP